MAYNKNAKFGLCMDWETSGASFGGDSTIDYQGLTFGAVIFNMKTFEIVDTLYVELKFDETKYKWSPEAEKIHGKTREHLAAHGVDAEVAAEELLNFIAKYIPLEEDIFFLGHNREFDVGFTKQLLNQFGVMFKLCDMRVMDTSGIGHVVFGIYKSDELFKFLGLPDRTEHNSLEDAIYTVMSCERIRMLMNSALGIA